MQQALIGLSLIMILGLAAVIFLLLKKKPEQKSDALLMLQQQLNQVSQTLDSKLSESNRSFQDQFQQSAKIIRDVTEKLTEIGDTNKQVINFAEQLQSLEDILTNPKQRGILGEFFLEEILKNVLPPSNYQMQYSFKDGEIVDAAIFVDDGKIIPIDSKFSLENYNRIIDEKDPARREELERAFGQDLKNRIDETSKYIRPNENTLSFALMFIPSEAIFYDLLVNKVGVIKGNTRDLLNYAVREKHVCIVSPNSFHAYLQTILQGLRAFHIEKTAQEIRKGVETLERHLSVYHEYFFKIGNHLSLTVTSFNSAYKELGKVDKDIVKITGGESQIEVKQIEKPLEGED